MQLVITSNDGDSLIIERKRHEYIVTVQTMQGDEASATFDKDDWRQLMNRIDVL